MSSWAGTGIVTTCTFTLVIRSTIGISMVSPGLRTSLCARPSRNTTPRSIWRTTRALTNHDAAIPSSTRAMTRARISMTTSDRAATRLREYAVHGPLPKGQTAAPSTSTSLSTSTGALRRPGRSTAAATAPTTQSRPTTTQAVLIAARKDSWKASTSRGSCTATACATATESCARPGTPPGSAAYEPLARCAPNTEEKTDPTTATPRVPPSSRVASLTALPTPARAGGSTSRIDSVAGVEIRPMPSPIITICGTITWEYDVSTAAVEIHTNAVPKSTMPVVTTILVPIRGASAAPTTDATAIDKATGRIRAPVDRAP